MHQVGFAGPSKSSCAAQVRGIVALRAFGGEGLKSATRYFKLVLMTYQELKARSHALRLIAEKAQDLPSEELLDSLDETMDHMTGPQKRSPLILADMTRWLLEIQNGMALNPAIG